LPGWAQVKSLRYHLLLMRRSQLTLEQKCAWMRERQAKLRRGEDPGDDEPEALHAGPQTYLRLHPADLAAIIAGVSSTIISYIRKGELTHPPKSKHEPEQMDRVNKVAEIFAISRKTVTRMFEDIQGVKIIGERSSNRKRRRYRTLLIPESVLKAQLKRLE
jgi:hypothetical protein